ncbi:MAG: methyltransferase protein, partial [Conexibacter sp.]|nr:methyltransferase protein [Conexibacter sp.]
MIAASRLSGAILARVGDRRLARLPFALAFWDGSVRPAAGEPSLGVVRVRRTAVGHLLREPNQLGLVRAFVAGDLDFDGDLEALLAQRGRFRGLRPSAADRALALALALLL